MCNGVIFRSMEEKAEEYVSYVLKDKGSTEWAAVYQALKGVLKNAFIAGWVADRKQLEDLGIKLYRGDNG